MLSPVFGAVLAGIMIAIVAIDLLITRIYMVSAGIEGTLLKKPALT